MSQIAATCASRGQPPALITKAGERASYRFLEFFTAQIRNPHTRRAYARAVGEFCAWLETHGVGSILGVNSVHVAAWIEALGRERLDEDGKPYVLTPASIKQRFAAIRMLFDWLATGGVLPFNPATAVRGPKHVVKRAKTPVLAADEARELLDAIDVSTPIGLRDRALIALMVYTFARIGAATAMKVEDVFVQNRRLWVRLHEKGGKFVTLPPATTILRPTCTPISTAQASPATSAARCSERSAAAREC